MADDQASSVDFRDSTDNPNYAEQTYEIVKREFEVCVGKVMNPFCFIVQNRDDPSIYQLVPKAHLIGMYENLFYYQETITAKGTVWKKKSFLKVWTFCLFLFLNHPH